MKQGTRLYINLTNKCNTDCPFCCMYSGTAKSTFLTFDTFKTIIDSCEGSFELQLEGGEPLLHPNLYLFIEYAIATKRCMKIIILSNGILISEHIKRIADVATYNKILIELKISINYWLLQEQEDFLEKLNWLCFATCDMEYINILFNVRKRTDDDWIEGELDKWGLKEQSNIFFLQSYGRLTDSNYEKPVIVQNIDNWRIYSCDGNCFGQDLIARSEHEKKLM